VGELRSLSAAEDIMKTPTLVIALAALLALAPATHAGIVDSPVPLLQGAKAAHVYSVAGVVTAGGLGTFFSCTSAATAAIRVSVELFDETGTDAINDASAVSLSVEPGASVTFTTQNTPSSAFPSAQLLTAAPVLLPVGSARILSTSKSVLCTAFLADVYTGPPSSMSYLTVVAKAKQKGG
jgi:hypothetical protein